MKIILITGITFALLLIIAVVGIFVLGNFAFMPPTPPSPSAPPVAPTPTRPPTPAPSPPVTGQPQSPVPSFEDKVANLFQALTEVAATGQSQEVTLLFTEAEVNEQVAKILTQAETPQDIPLEIKNVHIDLLSNNNLMAEVQTVAYGFQFTTKMKARVTTKEGKPDITITDVSFGAIPLPGAVKDKLTDSLRQKIDELVVQLTETGIADEKVVLEFKQITIQEEKMTLTVIIKPKA